MFKILLLAVVVLVVSEVDCVMSPWSCPNCYVWEVEAAERAADEGRVRTVERAVDEGQQ